MQITRMVGFLTRASGSYSLPAQGPVRYRTLMNSVKLDKTVYVTTPEEPKAPPTEEEPCLTYAEFRRTKTPSFDAYRQSPMVQALFDSHTPIEEIQSAYEDYCIIRYNHYRMEQQGGNPATMI